MLILDFNDSELRIADGDSVLARAPGFAFLEGKDFVLGESAAAKSRLNPRASYRNFWEQLDQQPLNRAAGRAQSHADIAYFHLQSLWQRACATFSGIPDGVILVVPAQYGAERLSLLLGIAQACAIPVQGVVDSAVLAAATQQYFPCQYLDISLHRVYRSQITAEGALHNAGELSQQGLVWCYEQLIKWIAAQFMAETRFDPLHEAASEQRLFDELPIWLKGFSQAERLSLSLSAGQRQHRIEVGRAQVIEQLQPLYQVLDTVAQAEQPLLLSHRFSVLPGLAERLNARQLSSEASLMFAAERAAELVSDPAAPVWIKQLQPQASRVEAAEPEPNSQPTTPRATHLLYEHSAYPLYPDGLALGAEPAAIGASSAASVRVEGGRVVLKTGATSPELQINGVAWEGGECELRPGDELRCGTQHYRLICVRDGC